MKTIARPSFLLSSYPLSAVRTPANQDTSKPGSPYLKAVLKGPSRPLSHNPNLKPTANPYRPGFTATAAPERKFKDAENGEKDWFKNYE